MEKRWEYRSLCLSGLGLLVLFGILFIWVGQAEEKESTAYAYLEKLFAEGVVQEIRIEIDEMDFADMLENPLEETYYDASVTINGETLYHTAIRTKGNNSLTTVASSDSDRYSFKLDFDYYDENGNYYGLKKLNLNNNYGDPSYMREYISYRLMEAIGLPVPATSYAHITINGEEWGLYLAVEQIDEVFLERTFGNSDGDLYKPDGIGSDLVYRGEDISQYTGLILKTNENTSDGSAILALMRALESGEGLEEVLDEEEALRYIAANVALANYDSYLGMTTHNYYLYEQDGVFTVIPWDYNYSFGGFGGGSVDIYDPTVMDMGRGSMERTPPAAEGDGEATQTAEEANRPWERMAQEAEQPQMPGGMGNSEEKPLVTTLLAQEELLTLYEEILLEIAQTYFTESYLAPLVAETAALIAPYVEQDATAFYTYEEFLAASSADASDPNSLVYFAVSMAESIQSQLGGGEPTFDTGSFAVAMGGGMGRGEWMPGQNGLAAEEGSRETEEGARDTEEGKSLTETETERMQPPQAQTKEMTEQTMAFGEEAPSEGMTQTAQPSAEESEDTIQQQMVPGGRQPPGIPEQIGGEGGKHPNGMGMQWSEIFLMSAVCVGIFLVGFLFLLCFKRRRELCMADRKKNTENG